MIKTEQNHYFDMKIKLIFILFIGIISPSIAQEQETGTVKKWTLQECIDYALENNITVKQSENDIKMAEIEKRGAIGNLLPNLNMNGNYGWGFGLSLDQSNVYRSVTSENMNVGASTNLNLWDGLQRINRLRKSELSILASRYQTDKIKDDITLNVINAYLQVLFDTEAINVAKPQLEISKEQLERSQKLAEAGTIPAGDLYEIQATVANDEQNLIVTENNKRLSLLSLAQLLQLENANNFDIANEEISTLPLVNLADYSVQQIFQKALENRNEIKVAQTNVSIAEKDIDISKGALQPTLSAGYSFNTLANDIPPLTGGGVDPVLDQFRDNRRSTVGFSLNIPVFNGFQASNNVRRAKINLEQQKYQLDQEELNLERTINTVYLDARGALKIYDAAQKSVEAQKESFRYAQEKFNVGVMNSFEFSQIKNNMVRAQADFLRAKYDFIFKVKLLEFYYGIPVEVN